LKSVGIPQSNQQTQLVAELLLPCKTL
jgi:hypothetical protein